MKPECDLTIEVIKQASEQLMRIGNDPRKIFVLLGRKELKYLRDECPYKHSMQPTFTHYGSIMGYPIIAVDLDSYMDVVYKDIKE